MSDDHIKMKRCTDCSEHSGMVAQLSGGKSCMERLETGLDELRKDFTTHVNASAKSTIAMLVGILMCFLTGVMGIYINHVNPKNNKQIEITMLVEEMTKAIKESKK